MKSLIRHRATFYTFLAGLKVSVIEDGFTRVLQVNEGTTVEAKHLSKAQQEFLDAGSEVAANYKSDKITAQKMLEAAATKYDTWRIHRAFAALPTMERNRAELEEAADFDPQRPPSEGQEATKLMIRWKLRLMMSPTEMVRRLFWVHFIASLLGTLTKVYTLLLVTASYRKGSVENGWQVSHVVLH